MLFVENLMRLPYDFLIIDCLYQMSQLSFGGIAAEKILLYWGIFGADLVLGRALTDIIVPNELIFWTDLFLELLLFTFDSFHVQSLGSWDVIGKLLLQWSWRVADRVIIGKAQIVLFIFLWLFNVLMFFCQGYLNGSGLFCVYGLIMALMRFEHFYSIYF